ATAGRTRRMATAPRRSTPSWNGAPTPALRAASAAPRPCSRASRSRPSIPGRPDRRPSPGNAPFIVSAHDDRDDHRKERSNMAKGTITHIEIPADDPERAKKFYSAVAGWEFGTMGD